MVKINSRPLYALERIPVPIKEETGWTPEMLWTFSRRKKSIVCGGIWILDLPARSSVSVTTALSRFRRRSGRTFVWSAGSGRLRKRMKILNTFGVSTENRTGHHSSASQWRRHMNYYWFQFQPIVCMLSLSTLLGHLTPGWINRSVCRI